MRLDGEKILVSKKISNSFRYGTRWRHLDTTVATEGCHDSQAVFFLDRFIVITFAPMDHSRTVQILGGGIRDEKPASPGFLKQNSLFKKCNRSFNASK